MRNENDIKIDEALNFVEEKIEEIRQISDIKTINLLEKTKNALERLKNERGI